MFRLANSVYNFADLILAEVWNVPIKLVIERLDKLKECRIFEDDQHLETDRCFGDQR